MRLLITVVAIALGFVLLRTFFRPKMEAKKSTLVQSFLKAGAPDQLKEVDEADLENSKMVSEGSQFGVQYFNEFIYH